MVTLSLYRTGVELDRQHKTTACYQSCELWASCNLADFSTEHTDARLVTLSDIHAGHAAALYRVLLLPATDSEPFPGWFSCLAELHVNARIPGFDQPRRPLTFYVGAAGDIATGIVRWAEPGDPEGAGWPRPGTPSMWMLGVRRSL